MLYLLQAHLESGKQSFRTLSYSLPADLVAHVEAVHPTTSFNKPVLSTRPVISTRSSRAPVNASILPDAVPASCASTITPGMLVLYLFSYVSNLI